MMTEPNLDRLCSTPVMDTDAALPDLASPEHIDPAGWAGGDPVRAARLCLLFAQLNVQELPEAEGGVSTLVSSTDVLLVAARRYLSDCCQRQGEAGRRLRQFQRQIESARTALRALTHAAPATVLKLAAQLGTLFDALASEEAS